MSDQLYMYDFKSTISLQEEENFCFLFQVVAVWQYNSLAALFCVYVQNQFIYFFICCS